MNNLKISIAYNFHKGAWGGGNQFLKGLRKIFIKKGIYENNPSKANCILFNSHHNIQEILRLKLKYQKEKVFIHRIDGPLYLVRGNDINLDRKIYEINNIIADGIILQSEWSRLKNYSIGLKRNIFETVIQNACDKTIFFPNQKKQNKEKEIKKCKLIAVSWSKNFNKGFDLYQFLDKNIDFNRYSMKFVGNSPISFKNIEHLDPINSRKLSNMLRESDIYITGSRNDPCSNSLIEALSCGLPCIALNDGGHPEIIKKGGELFNTCEECIQKIQLVKENYEIYRKNIITPDFNDISEQYLNFIKKIYDLQLCDKYKSKKLRLYDYYRLLLRNSLFQISNINFIRTEFQRIISTFKKKPGKHSYKNAY